MAAFGRTVDRQAQRDWWRHQIERHQQSGLSVVDFCARLGVRPKTFYAWRQRLSAAAATSSRISGKRWPVASSDSSGVPTAHFLPVTLRADATPGQLEIELGNSCVLRLTGVVDPALLRVAIDEAGRLGANKRKAR